MTRFEKEIQEVHQKLAALPETLHPTLRDFIQDEIARRQPLSLAKIVLAAAYPQKDTPVQRARRIDLAAALELLVVALGIHKLLLEGMDSSNSVGRSLAGGTVLAGDFCFSRAAALAAQTERPDVVAVFSQLLQQLSEGNLRTAFGQNDTHFDENELLYRTGAQAGALLADLPADLQIHTAAVGASLASVHTNGVVPSDGSRQADGVAPFQRERWQLLLNGSAG